MINDTLFDVSNVLIKDKNRFDELTDALKEKYFFIINRYLSKCSEKYAEFASQVNHKKIDKAAAFDAWYYFLYDKPYPKTYWAKSPKLEKDDGLNDKERTLLVQYYGVRVDDLDYLLQLFPKMVKEDLKWLTEIEKQNK
jgi:hypothetical protein